MDINLFQAISRGLEKSDVATRPSHVESVQIKEVVLVG